MVTLEQLCDRLGADLRPAAPGPIGRQQLTGVHISELEDPTPYLEGGELLLTTGIPLGGGDVATREYVDRLTQKGIAALALGLGAGTDRVDPALVAACAEANLDLLLVPEAVPFLHISRAFWALVGRSEQADLASRLDLQTALARAATRVNATQAIITTLAQGLGGWAAYLPADGAAETIWPVGTASLVPQLRIESARLDLVGTYSAATFPVGGMNVVEHSIMTGQRTVGFLAVSAGRDLQKPDRQLILTSCMLLSLTVKREQETSLADVALGGVIASLVLAGLVDAARLASGHAAMQPMGDVVRILAVRAVSPARLDDHELAAVISSLHIVAADSDLTTVELRDRIAGSMLRAMVGDICLVILPEPGLPGAPTTPIPVQGGATTYAAALSQPLTLEAVAGSVAQVAFACRRAEPGTIGVVDGSHDDRGDNWVDALARHPRGDLSDTVRTYLAHRGQWEGAARELGIHRNSLRHRIATATELIGADLTDPDTAATLWIVLRNRSLAN